MMSNGDNAIDYSRLDHPGILSILFHPRPSMGPPPVSPTAVLSIPTNDGEMIDAVCHPGQAPGPIILFFHGNGEIVDDYAPLAPLITGLPATFVPVEYRGYGRSTGQPSVSAMMTDAHRVADFMDTWLADQNIGGPMIIMGRSLGSAPALALAARSKQVAGLIIESGFARGKDLLLRLGISSNLIDGVAEPLFGNIKNIASVTLPTLIIHGKWDQVIPVEEARLLHEHSAADNRQVVLIDGADHNSLWAVGAEQYLTAISAFVRSIA